MKLVPTDPPGRVTRKARQFESDIAQLRAQGYSLDAIRRALACVGVHVSTSTVRREANRRTAAPAGIAGSGRAAHASHPALPPATASATKALPAPPILAVASDEASGKDQAEAFLRRQVTNPLLRAKVQP